MVWPPNPAVLFLKLTPDGLISHRITGNPANFHVTDGIYPSLSLSTCLPKSFSKIIPTPGRPHWQSPTIPNLRALSRSAGSCLSQSGCPPLSPQRPSLKNLTFQAWLLSSCWRITILHAIKQKCRFIST